MTDEELLALVGREFENAMGGDGGEIAKERAQAWDFYMSKPLGNELEGQSQVVTSDVADVVDGIMPSLLRIFTTADNLVGFDPVGSEDTELAEQESDYVNHVFFKHNPSFELLYTWFFDALVQKNGVVKAWWDESETVTRESYQGLDGAALAELLSDEELEPVERDEREAETVAPDGETIIRETVHDVVFRRVTKEGRVRIANVPPEEYRISRDARSLDPTEARMVGHEREATRSELIEMGFDRDLVESLPSHGDLTRTEEDTARRDKSDETDDSPHDPSQENILVREAYVRVDFDDDGRSELRQVIVAGGELLSNEEFDRSPFHVISPHPLPHKHFGLASAEKVMDVQEVTTTLLRQQLDNLYHTNNPGHAVWEQAMGEDTLDDLLVTRVGRVARFSRPVSESWAPMAVPFTASATFPALEFWDKVKRDRTGIASDGQGLSPEALKNIQTTVLAQAADLSRMKIEAVARIFAETGVKSLFRHIHELLLKHQKKAEVVKLRGEWIEVDPREWRTRRNMTVHVGLGIGTREQNLIHLEAIWQKQQDVVNTGGFGTLVTPMNVFNAAAEVVKNANLKDPELFFTPAEEIAPQNDAADLQIQLAARQQELDAREQQLDQARITLQHQREMEELELKRQAESNRLFVELEKIATKLTELELKSGENVPGSKV